MSVVSIDRQDRDLAQPAAVNGGAMDRVVERKGIDKRLKAGLIAGLVAIAGVGFYAYAPSADTQTVTAERTTISSVTTGTFEDFLPLRGRVTPLVTVYLDAVEGGRVERLLVEDGATVEKGQLLAVLSNAELQLSVLARETEVTQQLNSMRSQELALVQSDLANERAVIEAELAATKSRRQYELQAPLAERGFVAGRTFNDTRDDYESNRARMAVLKRARATENRLQASQLGQLRQSAASLTQALQLARANLDQLNLRAPVSGQLTAFSIQIGQSMQRGERLGQIDSPGRSKLIAGVDEFYLGRVQPGQLATIEHGGKTYRMKVAKLYPQVRNGQFEVDLVFDGPEPKGISRGQTLQARLTLGDPSRSRLIPNGAFYNDTGGTWVFVVSPDGSVAEKRTVRLGRRNQDFIEVLDGLEPGEKVLTSPYTGLTDKSRLTLKTAS